VSVKIRHLQYKVRQVQYKISEITGICRGCTLPVFTRKYPANAWLFRSNCCFFVLFVPLLAEAGYGCLVLVASNVFAITNLTLRAETKTMHPHECGNPKCKVIALGWLSDERFPRACSTSAGCFACKQDSGRESSWHPLPMPNSTNSKASCDALLRRKGGCPVHQLAHSWLQYRLTRA
jgi:hypothetical protein